VTVHFDRVIDRFNSDSLKWRRCSSGGIIPMWVADMDFASPECVIRALRQRVDEGVFGYPVATDALSWAVIAWAESHYGWRIEPQWLVWLPGLVPGIHLVAMAFAAAGDEVLMFVPVYPPFLSAPASSGRQVKTVPLACRDGRWILDMEALEQAITPRSRVLLFCHPHNPVGRVFDAAELAAVADVCRRHGLIVCSDEIHCDLRLEPGRHIPFVSIDDSLAERTVTLMSAAKTFNLSGLRCGFAVIADADLRKRFRQAAYELVPPPNVLGYAACRAAYEEGEPWRAELIEYLRGNRDLLESFLAERLPMIGMSHVEATYLAWLDTRRLGERNTPQFFEAAGVRLSDGAHFQGPGRMRLNFGCPRATLEEALRRIERAVGRPA
jgi:cystathionine beta-lyase